MFTCKKLEVCAFHCSSGLPCQVLSTDKHTFPSRYKLGLNLTECLPVVSKFINIGVLG